jgi:hypothetical protein
MEDILSVIYSGVLRPQRNKEAGKTRQRRMKRREATTALFTKYVASNGTPHQLPVTRINPHSGQTYATRRQWRRAVEGGAKLKLRQIKEIYARDKAICHWCRWWVPVEEASREHLLPVSLYPSLAKDIRFIVLAHKECNK